MSDSQEVAGALTLALQKMVPAAREQGLERSAQILTEVIGVLAYEAAGYRLPSCGECSLPRSDDTLVARINRDRVVTMFGEGDGGGGHRGFAEQMGQVTLADDAVTSEDENGD